MKVRRNVLATAMFVFALLGPAAPAAHAWDCSGLSPDVDARPACAAAARVICAVAAKGEPCIG